jgi:tetratricopeptide (TPR) repeat protein
MPRKPRTKEEEFFHAMKLADAGKHAKAIEAYTALIEKYPDYDRPYNERAMTRLHLNQNEEAVADFRRCLAINPDYPGARDWLARTLFGLKRFAEAAAEKREELRRRPEPFRGWGFAPRAGPNAPTITVPRGTTRPRSPFSTITSATTRTRSPATPAIRPPRCGGTPS